MSSYNQDKLVSVIIPSYNSARFLKQSVGSVLAQSYSNLEVIVVNDGSTDDTDEIAKQFEGDKRFFYYKKKNEGVSKTRNYGAAKAKGEYLAFLDADDVFFDDCLKRKVEVLNNSPEVGVVHADVEYLSEDGERLSKFNKGMSGSKKHLDVLAWNECVIPAFCSNALIKREFYQKAGEWDQELSTAADQDFMIRLCKVTSILRIPEVLVGYRIVTGSLGRRSKVFEHDHELVYKRAKERGDFESKGFMNQCFAKLHLIIAGTWWVQNKDFFRTLKHLVLSLRYSPKPILNKLASYFGK